MARDDSDLSHLDLVREALMGRFAEAPDTPRSSSALAGADARAALGTPCPRPASLHEARDPSPGEVKALAASKAVLKGGWRRAAACGAPKLPLVNMSPPRGWDKLRHPPPPPRAMHMARGGWDLEDSIESVESSAERRSRSPRPQDSRPGRWARKAPAPAQAPRGVQPLRPLRSPTAPQPGDRDAFARVAQALDGPASPAAIAAPASSSSWEGAASAALAPPAYALGPRPVAGPMLRPRGGGGRSWDYFRTKSKYERAMDLPYCRDPAAPDGLTEKARNWVRGPWIQKRRARDSLSQASGPRRC